MPSWLIVSLEHDVDLLRMLLLYLETRQVSPRATVVIVIAEEADELTYDAKAIEDGLNLLLDLGYVEGPGGDADGIWLFRKLTQKGIEFVRAASDPAEWEKIKQRRGIRSTGHLQK